MSIPQTIKVGDNLYLVKRIVRFKPDMNIQDWKEWLGCTHSFKKDDHIYFVNEIEVLEYIDVNVESN
jgi:hypothetical protein